MSFRAFSFALKPFGCVCLCSEFPPTSIVVGGLDPLLDDAIELHARLRRLQVPVQLKVRGAFPFKFVEWHCSVVAMPACLLLQVFRNLPHGFMGASFLPVTRPAVELMRRWSCTPLSTPSPLSPSFKPVSL